MSSLETRFRRWFHFRTGALQLQRRTCLPAGCEAKQWGWPVISLFFPVLLSRSEGGSHLQATGTSLRDLAVSPRPTLSLGSVRSRRPCRPMCLLPCLSLSGLAATPGHPRRPLPPWTSHSHTANSRQPGYFVPFVCEEALWLCILETGYQVADV